MSLLSICRAACATAPVAVPTAIVGNEDETATLLLALANDAGDELARRPQGGWVAMIREYDFTTMALAEQPGTIANVGGFGVISGISTTGIAPGIWQVSGFGVPNNAVVTAVTGYDPFSPSFSPSFGGGGTGTVTINLPATSVGSGSFIFGQSDYPLPADFQRPVDNTFWDRSRFWQMRGPLSPQQWQVYKSSIIGRASIERRFRFRSIRNAAGGSPATYLSIDPSPLDNGAQLVFEYVSNGWCESVSGTPQNSWEADSDVGVLDEYLLRLSLKYRLLRRLGLSYSEELDEFERQVDKAVAIDGGARILNMTPSGSFYLGYGNVPESGYGGPSPEFAFGGGAFGGNAF